MKQTDSSGQTCYELLQVHPAAPLDLITAAYWRLVGQAQEKRGSDPSSEALLHQLTRAYQTLADPAQRPQYDAALGIAEQEAAPQVPRPRQGLLGRAFQRESGTRRIDYYEILRVTPQAELAILTEAYATLRSYYLRLVNTGQAKAELMDALEEAYRVTSDPRRRSFYDDERSRWAEEGKPFTGSGSGRANGRAPTIPPPPGPLLRSALAAPPDHAPMKVSQPSSPSLSGQPQAEVLTASPEPRVSPDSADAHEASIAAGLTEPPEPQSSAKLNAIESPVLLETPAQPSPGPEGRAQIDELPVTSEVMAEHLFESEQPPVGRIDAVANAAVENSVTDAEPIEVKNETNELRSPPLISADATDARGMTPPAEDAGDSPAASDGKEHRTSGDQGAIMGAIKQLEGLLPERMRPHGEKEENAEQVFLRRLSSSATQPIAGPVDRPHAILTVAEGASGGPTYRFERFPITIGSADDCDLVLPGLKPRQARVLYRDGRFVVYNLTGPDDPASAAWMVLESGDEFGLGSYSLRLGLREP